jgi:hypothetical protein
VNPAPPAPASTLQPPTTAEFGPTDFAEDPELPKACSDVRRVRDILARLGLQAMAYRGRIDARIFEPATEAGPIATDDAAPEPQGRDRERSAFGSALVALNRDEDALRVFHANLAAVNRRCTIDPDLCPTQALEIDVRRVDPHAGLTEFAQKHDVKMAGEYWSWRVTGGMPPTAEQWEASFLSLYNYTSKECPLLPALALQECPDGSACNELNPSVLGFAMQNHGVTSGHGVTANDCLGTGDCTHCGPTKSYHKYYGGVCCGSVCKD